MLSVRDFLLLVLCSRLANASPLVARYANTTFSRPAVYTLAPSSTTSFAYIQPAAADSSSKSKTCTDSPEVESSLPPKESPSAYGLGVLTAPAPTTPPAPTSLDFTFVGQHATSEAAPHYSYAPEQSSSSIEVASASSYSTRRYSKATTVTRSLSTMVTLTTTVQPKGYGVLKTGTGGDVTVTSVTTIYPDIASSSPAPAQPEHTASSSTAAANGSTHTAYQRSSTAEASMTTSSKDAPQYTKSNGEELTTTSSEHSAPTPEASTTLFAYQPHSDETTSTSSHSTPTSTATATTTTLEAAAPTYAYPLPSPSSSEATSSTEASATAYSVPSAQTSLPSVIVNPYGGSPTPSSNVAQSSTSAMLGGITIVPVSPYSSASTSVDDGKETVTVTVTDAGVTKTVTVAKGTVTVKAY